MKKTRKQLKNWLKWSAPLGLAIALTACGGNDKNANANASGASQTAASTASASPIASPDATVSASPTASPSAANASPDSGPKAGYQLYEDADSGVSMQYPSDWTTQNNVPGVTAAFLSPAESDSDAFRENVTLVVQDLGDADTGSIEEYADQTKQALEKMITDFKLINSETSAEDNGFSLEYSGKQGQLDLHWQQAAFIDGGKAYVVTYTAEPDKVDKFQDTVAEMVDTLTYK